MANYSDKVCVICGDVFKPASPKQKVCGKQECSAVIRRQAEKARYYKNKGPVERKCPICESTFKTTKENKKYCGSEVCERERLRIKAIRIEKTRGSRTEYKKEYYNKNVEEIKEKKKLRAVHQGFIVEDTCSSDKNLDNFNPQKEIFEYVKGLLPDEEVIENDRKAIGPKELDIFVPAKKLAIEYCGLYWHSNAGGKENNYHYNKMMLCYDKGIRLITIFEDEYLDKPDVVLSRIKNALGVSDRVVYARKCFIRELTYQQTSVFLDKYHLQGNSLSSMRFGLFLGSELLQVMTFGHLSRTHTQIKGKKTAELKRFACIPGISVVGGASKLFKYGLKYLKAAEFEYVKSYCDMRFANIFNTVYTKLGFELLCYTKYTPHYVKGQKRYRNQGLRKTPEERLTGKTEWQLREEQGYRRIFDCGHRTYIYEIK